MFTRRRLGTALVVLAAVAVTVGPVASAPGTGSAGAATTALAPMQGSYAFGLTFDGLRRDYRLHVPPAASTGTPLPLVLNLHGATQNGFLEELQTGMDNSADRDGYLVAYPDGTRIAFVSTLYNRRFHIFTADVSGGALSNLQRLTGENKSELPRYYYSHYDHEINPVWSRDGRDIVYVSNRNHIYGTGGFWRHRMRHFDVKGDLGAPSGRNA